MCYCCCPPAITALLCLWVRSGFSKGTVAGALTFFPPNPSFYKFQRINDSGEELDETEDDEKDKTESSDESIDDLQLESNSNNSTNHELEKQRKQQSSHEATLAEKTKKLKERSKKRFIRDSRDAANGIQYKFKPDSRIPKPKFEGTVSAYKLYNAKAQSYIATVIYRTKNLTPHTKTLIYSHGNATDIGAMSYIQAILVRNLDMNVVMYDYSGYGESGGMPLENNTYWDIEVVYKYVLEKVANRNAKNLIIYGQSVGSGPSCYISSKKEVGGLILHSPFMSGMRVLTPSRALACLDIYPNIDRIKRVKCPVLLIHGVQDEEVDISHGHALYEAVDEQYKRDPWWVPDRGHNDITEGPGKMSDYIKKLRTFLRSLDEFDIQGPNDEDGHDDSIEATLVKKGVMVR